MTESEAQVFLVSGELSELFFLDASHQIYLCLRLEEEGGKSSAAEGVWSIAENRWNVTIPRLLFQSFYDSPRTKSARLFLKESRSGEGAHHSGGNQAGRNSAAPEISLEIDFAKQRH